MTRRLKCILSDEELREADEELYREVVRHERDVLSGLVRQSAYVGRDVFPVDGYITWQERWRQGTGVTPKGWKDYH